MPNHLPSQLRPSGILAPLFVILMLLKSLMLPSVRRRRVSRPLWELAIKKRRMPQARRMLQLQARMMMPPQVRRMVLLISEDCPPRGAWKKWVDRKAFWLQLASYFCFFLFVSEMLNFLVALAQCLDGLLIYEILCNVPFYPLPELCTYAMHTCTWACLFIVFYG